MTAASDTVWPEIDAPIATIAPSVAEITALTTRLARGDDAAWREFFDGYFSRLLRYLIVLHGGREDLAHEALQLTMLRVAKHVRSFQSEEAFWDWLTVLARSAVVDEARKKKRYFNFLSRLRSEPNSGPVSTDEPLHAALEQSIALLPDEDRSLIERKYFDRCSVRELAESGQTSEKAIESRLGRIRRKLKSLLLTRLRHETT